MPTEILSSAAATESSSTGVSGSLVLNGNTTAGCGIQSNNAIMDPCRPLRPKEVLASTARKYGLDLVSKEFALKMDELDPLREQQKLFCFPKKRNLPNREYMIQCIVFRL